MSGFWWVTFVRLTLLCAPHLLSAYLGIFQAIDVKVPKIFSSRLRRSQAKTLFGRGPSRKKYERFFIG